MECRIHIGENVVVTDMRDKLGLLKKSGRLIPRTAEKERLSRFLESVRKDLQGIETGRVDRSHIAQAQDDDRGEAFQICGLFFQFVGRSEEKRPMNPQD